MKTIFKTQASFIGYSGKKRFLKTASIIKMAFLFIASFLVQSCSEIISEKNISDKSVVLLSPADNAQFFSTGVTFNWEAVQYATKYQLQIAKPSFANPTQIVLDATLTTTTSTQQLPIGNYEWRVKAMNESYSTAYSSRIFTVVSNTDFQSNMVVLSTPANNLITKTALQTLSWQPIIGATGYQVQIYDAANTIIANQTTTNPTMSYTFPDGALQWRVRATNGTQQTLYTAQSILVDTIIPNVPTATSPANATNLTAGSINFQWTRTPIAGSVEKDHIYIYKDAALTILQTDNETTSPFTTTISTPGTYYWYLKSNDQAGNVSIQSPTFNFIVN